MFDYAGNGILDHNVYNLERIKHKSNKLMNRHLNQNIGVFDKRYICPII